jgi:2-polyprenyl-6-methoxyphenol hydroxylase-like FAD-dependent oxidoreductase
MENLRILVSGAGVAGLTLAALLKREGLTVKVIEKESEKKHNESGYMLGLLPPGGRVLTELDLEQQYFEDSIQMNSYEIHKEDGSLNKAFPLDFINENYGSYRGIGRKELIDLLRLKLGEDQVHFETSIEEVRHHGDHLIVTYSGGGSEAFDLLVIAEGINSQSRKLFWKEGEYEYYDTHWGGWVGWLEGHQMDSYKEYWGASSIIGLYPVKGKTGIFLGGPSKEIKELGLAKFALKEKAEIKSEHSLLHKALDKLLASPEPYFWEFKDVRTIEWHKENVILLGDAACGFLPTAGVGASMAMDSAAALADELSRTDKAHLEYGLNLFEQRQKDRVESAQLDSRNLARFMFVKSRIMASIRDYGVRFYTLQEMLKNISKTIEGVY